MIQDRYAKVIAVALSIGAAPLAAQVVNTWNGEGGDDNFSNAGNWNGAAPATGADDEIMRLGAEGGTSPNYSVDLDQSKSIGGGARGQELGRFEFVSGADSYNLNNTAADPDLLYALFGIAEGGGAPAGEFTAISNTSGVNQTFNVGIRQEAPGNQSGIEYNVYDAGTGGLTFTKNIEFANNAKDMVLRGSGDIDFTNIDNTTGSSASFIVEVDNGSTVTVSESIIDVPSIEVNSGTLLMTGTGDVIADSNNTAKSTDLTLGGGTFELGGTDPQTAEFFGTLTLTEDSVIDFGNAGGTITFDDSSGEIWDPNATLTIANWEGIAIDGGGKDQLFFGDDGTGLTAQQLSQIRFENEGTFNLHLPDGEVVPVPEPAAVASALGLTALICWRERRRLKRIWSTSQ
ncbi:MAG: hypothetical protein R6U56_06205 [Opitutales bacterium]